MSGLHIEQPGPRATIQDLGRLGYQHHGLSPGGAADLRSFRWANRLLDNDANAACLEVTLGGLTATATQPLILALTGADCRGTVNGAAIQHWGVFRMAKGDQLRLDRPEAGLLTYLAVAGGWQTRLFCGSRSCVVREGLAGLGQVAAGTELPARTPDSDRDIHPYLHRTVPAHLRPNLHSDAALPLIPGPEYDTFSAIDQARLLGARYTISGRSDRMAYRLEGPALASRGGITSRGITCGAVQVPGDGKPMVLLNDRQTIGGYPVVGTVPRLDCGRLAQKCPEQPVTFALADVANCQAERMLFERLIDMTTWSSTGAPIRKA